MISSTSFLRSFGCTLLLVVSVALTSRVSAALPGDPLAVSVGLKGKIISGSGSLTIGVTAENGYQSVGASGSGSQTGQAYISMVPGQGYNFTSNFSSITQFEFFLSAPAGYEVVFGEVKSDGVRHTVPGGQTNTTYRAHLRSTQYLPAGQSSDLGVGRVRWSLGLGSLRNGDPAGVIQLREDNALASLSPNDLILESGNPQVDRIVVGGTFRQVLAPQCLVDISTASNVLYLKCYAYTAITTQNGDGTWNFTGSPFAEYAIDRPTGYNPILRITRTNNLGGTRTDWTHMEQFGNSWHIIPWTNSAVAWPNWSTSRMWATDAAQSDRYITWQRSDGTTQAQDHLVYSSGQLTKREEGIGQPYPFTTDYTYKPGTDPAGVAGQVNTIVKSDGSWTRFDYHTSYPYTGKIWKTHQPFADHVTTVPSSSSNTDGVVTTTTYQTVAFASTIPGSPTTYLVIKPTSVITTHKKTSGSVATTRRSDYSYSTSTRNSLPVLITTRTDYASSGTTLPTVTVTYAPSADEINGYYSGKPHSVTRPDGTMTAYAYVRGIPSTDFRSITPNSSGTWIAVTRLEGHTFTSSGSPVSTWGGWTLESGFRAQAGRSTAHTSNHSSSGDQISEIKSVFTGSSWATTASDLHAHIQGINGYRTYTYRNEGTGTSSYYTLEQGFVGGFRTWTRDEVGVTTTFAYDHNGRVSMDSRSQVTGQPYSGTLYTHYSYDGPGRLITKRLAPTTGGDDGTHLLEQWAYDWADRLTSQTTRAVDGSSVTNVTTTYNQVWGGDFRVTRRLNPDNGEVYSKIHRDGTHRATWGSGTVPSYTFYDVDTAGYITKTTAATDSVTGNSWSSQQMDWLDRMVRFTRANADGSTSYESLTYGTSSGCSCRSRIQSRQWFNGSGQAILAPQRFYYTAMGDLEFEGWDLNGNSNLDSSSSDRMVNYQYSIESNSGWWLVVDRLVLTNANDGVYHLQETTKRRLAGNSSSSRGMTRHFDPNDNLTETETKISRSIAQLLIETTVPGSATKAYTDSRNGFLASERTSTGVLTSYTYDTLGRLSRTQGRDSVRADYIYYSGTTLPSAVRNANLGSAGNEWISFSYDKMGRNTLRTTKTGTSPSSVTERRAFDARGNVTHEWGTATNSSYRTYDTSTNQLLTLSTYRSTSASWDSSTWPSPGTADTTTWTIHGASGLVTTIADAAGRTTSFTYNARQQVATRTAQRASGVNVVTTYGYSETSTARTGELTSISYNDGTPTVSYSYTQNSGHSRLGLPTWIGDAAGGRTLGYRLHDGQPEFEWLSQSYYGSNGTGRDVWYAYDSTSGTVGRPTGYDVGWGTQHNSILEYRLSYDSVGRPQTITTGGGFGARSFTYAYQSNSHNISTLTSGSYVRTNAWQSWRELTDSVTTTWSSTPKAHFAYNYDWMSRRSDEKVTGQLPQSLSGWSVPYGHANVWTYDSRSQVTKSEPYKLTSGGAIDTVTPATSAMREWTFDPIGNRTQEKRAGGSWLGWSANNLNQVTATPSGGVNLGNPTYDWTGNMTAQNGWTYTYDGENRLRTATPSSGAFYRYSYDYLGRRVRKEKVSGSTVLEDTKFIWVGWQLIAELDGLNINGSGAGNVKRSYAWGIDAMGTLGGAGGTGALLMIREDNAGPRYLPIYDNRQNVRGYLDESGNIVAAYEYTAFGETVASGGSYTTAPIRYASLYQDSETGMYYHHHRYYHPGFGRFINRDPIGAAGGLNLYAYVGNGAPNRWDRLGLDWEWECTTTYTSVFVIDGDNSYWDWTEETECSLYWRPSPGDSDSGGGSGGRNDTESEIAPYPNDVYFDSLGRPRDTGSRENTTVLLGMASVSPPSKFDPHNDPCEKLFQDILDLARHIRGRYNDMLLDKGGLYGTRGTGKGSWRGHQEQFEGQQRRLRHAIQTYYDRGCGQKKPLPGYASIEAQRATPSRPLRVEVSIFDNWINSISITDETLNQIQQGALITTGVAATVATGGIAGPYLPLMGVGIGGAVLAQ